MSDGSVLRFRLRWEDKEIELEGEFNYVREKFEDLLDDFNTSLREHKPPATQGAETAMSPSLQGILETTPEGRPFLTVPFDLLTSKEAVALFLYAHRPSKISDKDLSTLLTQGWKTTRAEAVRARASELRREGKLLAEDGAYALSGAGIQWVESDIIHKLRKANQESPG